MLIPSMSTLEQDRFIKIIEEHLGILIKIAKGFTNNYQDQQDLMNEIVLQLWKSFGKFRGDSQLSTWIYRVALNTSLNYQRFRNKFKLEFLEDVKHTLIADSLTDEDDNSCDEAILYDCIGELVPLNRAIIMLYLDGNPHEQISQIMGISKTNVGTRISRILKELKELAVKKV